MSQLFGEHDCKLDAKSRMRIPSPLLKQLGEEGPHSFVLNRGLEKCLILYPKGIWDKTVEEINKLNPFVEANRKFSRFFYRGATKLITDSADRILVPKRLAEYAGIKKEVIVIGLNNRIEIWAAEKYDDLMDEDAEEFSDLAQQVMGGLTPPQNPEE